MTPQSAQISRRRALAALLGTAAFVALGGCRGDEEEGDTPTGGTGRLPPATIAGLRPIFDPRFAPLGLRLTRGSLVDTAGTQYRPSSQGEHLALYVEPLDDASWDADQYVAALVPGVAAVTPFSFRTWPGLQSLDLCQEPAQADDPRPEPLPVTQYELSRADSGLIDWPRVDLVALVAAVLRSPDTARLVTTGALDAHPAITAARIEAQRVTGIANP